MKERPIIFAGESVRAIMDGRKTQSRRIVKPQPVLPNSLTRITDMNPGFVDSWGREFRCPYEVGSLLWVRETWNGTQGEGVAYRATEPQMDGEPWKSPLFMPRHASRLTLEIVSVRVERVQDISHDDAIAEGIRVDEEGHVIRDGDDINWGSPVGAFANLWNEINGKKPGASWSENPFCWCVEFKRVESEARP